MRLPKEKFYHGLFEIGIIIKFGLAVLEVIGGITLYIVSTATVSNILYGLTGDELNEVPADFFARALSHELNSFLNTPQSFWAFLFLSHGIVKLLLAAGLLWWKKLWLYPLVAFVFAVFVVSQLWQMAYTPSASLVIITVFDIVLIVLILREYRHKRHAKTSGIL